MFDSPLSASAYEVLGVAATVDHEELRRAYRLQLRRTHPDTGGDASVFIQVQRAWELVGTPELRAAYDRGHGFAEDDTAWDGWRAPSARTDTRPRAKSSGEAGGRQRRRFVALVQEWAGSAVPDPYDPAFVRTVPRELRRLLADALAEEDTARSVGDLGMGFTAWHDVAVPAGPAAGPNTAQELDKLAHIVLGPSGLYGLMSADFGGIVRFRGGEVIGTEAGGPAGDRAPITALLTQIRVVSRAARVKFGGAILVLPDDDLAQAIVPLGSIRGTTVVVVRRSALRTLLREGVPGSRTIGGTELFDLRTRIQHTVRFA
ncbi:J domain-containing protein [Microbacterium capsulatum]|uniref:J domain-containing protein n=1 Tax=Microbacterium capsulatum TaxID=3041921 RepID=A0ABU0XJV3_9MICO|nr:J domain-containing protein [Microbacterium sp. ASV81]MDQ4214863.1 J domain-containing protein [Microbacterium sp. ASV81]